MTRNKKIIIAGGIILVIGIAVFAFQFSAPQKATGEDVRIVVHLGPGGDDTVTSVVHFLYHKGIIRNENLFSLLAQLLLLPRGIEPGTYYIPYGLNAFQVIKELKGPPDEKFLPLEDERLGYEMKYPSTWSIVEERENFGIELSRIVFQSKDYEEKESEEYKERVEAGEETGLLQPMVMVDGVKLELLLTEIPSDFGWRDWAGRATDYPYGKLISEEFFMLGEKEIYGRQVESGEIASIVISFPDSEETKLFELILHTLQKDKEKNLETLNQILSTFSFLQTSGVKLIPSDFFTPSFNEEDKIEFKAKDEQIELLE